MVSVQVFKSELFGYTKTFKTVFVKQFMKWLLPHTKILSLKSNIKKVVAVSVSKQSMNKTNSKKVFPKFWLFSLLHHLVAAYRGVFKTRSFIYNGVYFAKTLNCIKLLPIFAKKGSITDVLLVWKYRFLASRF